MPISRWRTSIYATRIRWNRDRVVSAKAQRVWISEPYAPRRLGLMGVSLKERIELVLFVAVFAGGALFFPLPFLLKQPGQCLLFVAVLNDTPA